MKWLLNFVLNENDSFFTAFSKCAGCFVLLWACVSFVCVNYLMDVADVKPAYQLMTVIGLQIFIFVFGFSFILELNSRFKAALTLLLTCVILVLGLFAQSF